MKENNILLFPVCLLDFNVILKAKHIFLWKVYSSDVK